MVDEEYRGRRHWSRNRQAAGTVVWISFLTAAIATMVFFAMFDPLELANAIGGDLDISREAGYALGFFFFWLLTLCASAVTAWLIHTAPERGEKHRS